ncbi:MAG: hypothetical protein ACQEVA_19265 [Myxococcota bacterium]
MDTILKHVVRGGELPEAPDQIVAECGRERLGGALIALSSEETVRAWAGTRGLDLDDTLAMIASVSAESEAIDAAIDARLSSDEPEALIDALARAGVAWTHPVLEEALDHDELRGAAALLLAVADPDALRAWIEGCDVYEDAFVALRAVAMAGAHSLADLVEDWREQVVDFDEAQAEIAVLDGLMAVLEADSYARAVLAGDADIAWVADSASVADFLQVYGPGEWLSVLSFLDVCDDDAFEFAAFLSTCAAQGIGFEEPTESDASDLIGLLAFEPSADPEDWEPLATKMGLGFAIAMAVDDELALLGAQVGAHERLVAYGFHSPGVPGLPMSGTDPENLDFEASAGMLRQLLDGPSMPEAAKVAVVRTLFDLSNHVEIGDGHVDAHAEKWASRFSDSDSDAISLAARSLKCALSRSAVGAERAAMQERATLQGAMVLAAHGESSADIVHALQRAARGEKVLGLAATQQLAMLGTLDALDALADLWEHGSVFRAPIYRDALLTGAHVYVDAL